MIVTQGFAVRKVTEYEFNCPYCKEEQMVDRKSLAFYKLEDYECQECEKTFEVDIEEFEYINED